MTISRRDFFKGSALFGTALLNARKAFSRPQSVTEYRFPVIQGATSFTKTQISVMAAEDIVITVPKGKVTVEKVTKKFSVWHAHRVFVEDLLPGTEYELRISTREGVVLDTRKFSTLKTDKSQVKIALASCMRDTKAEQQGAMWKAMEESKPDLLFLLGDNVYVDDDKNTEKFISEERIWRRYVETRLTLDLYHWKKLIPTVATWDDHDFGLNNTLGNVPWREASTRVFRTLYAQDAIMPEVTWGPGIATSFTAYGQRFYLMDNRSFRSLKFLGTTHWGTNQEEWLFNNLGQAKSVGWILTGSQVFGGYRSGWSYENNHPGSLKKVLKRLSNIEAPVLFGTGDVHYTEIMKIEKEQLGYETIEITSSSMHSNAKEPRKGNPRRIASIGEFNFVIATVDVEVQGLKMILRSVGVGGKEYFAIDQVQIKR